MIRQRIEREVDREIMPCIKDSKVELLAEP
jgi:hypothetical protein